MITETAAQYRCSLEGHIAYGRLFLANALIRIFQGLSPGGTVCGLFISMLDFLFHFSSMHGVNLLHLYTMKLHYP